MEDLSKIVGGAQTAEAEARAAAKKVKDEAITQLEAAQRNIAIATETTGSPLHDGLIVQYGSDLVHEPRIVENYEETAEQLKGKSGEPVVLVNRWTRNEGCTGFGGKGHMVLRKMVYVGLLEGDELVFDYSDDRFYLPTSRYASLGHEHGTQVHREDGRLPVSSQLGRWRWSGMGDFDLGCDLHQTVDQEGLGGAQLLYHHGEPIKALTLAIGYEGIKSWLAEGEAPLNSMNGEFGTVRDLCDTLEIPKIEPVTDEQKRYLGQYAA